MTGWPTSPSSVTGGCCGPYAQAVESGWLVANPVLDVEEAKRPVVLQRSRLPQLLPPAVLALLQDPQVVTACYPPKRGNAGAPCATAPPCWCWRTAASPPAS